MRLLLIILLLFVIPQQQKKEPVKKDSLKIVVQYQKVLSRLDSAIIKLKIIKAKKDSLKKGKSK